MSKDLDKHQEIISFLKTLRQEIIAAFENLEPNSRFVDKPWSYRQGKGGGTMGILRGSVFEKAAVNWSGIEGSSFPMQDGTGPFFATGISLITHMSNPHAPTVHMNLRFLQTENACWLGGGYDLTPMGFPYLEDTKHFHKVARDTLDRFDTSLYPKLSAEARNYFFIPHWRKERGVGGVFFDHQPISFLPVWKGLGTSFLDAILPIYQKRISQPYTQEDREKQLQMRAHYVEFNLLYDRGTQFGFRSGGNPEAILCSMPPIATW